MIIPGAPQAGGDLAKYLTKYSSEIGWMPDAKSTISKDIQGVLGGEENDPAVWISYAATTLQRVWGSLPPDTRNAMQDVFSQLALRGLQGLGSVGGAATAAVSNASGAVPLIGTIIEALLSAIFGFIGLAKQTESKRETTAARHFMDSTRWTVEQYTHPNSWVLKKSKVANYLDRYDRDWWYRPSFSRSGGGSDQMFTSNVGKSDTGKCGGHGVEVYCGTRTYVNMGDCHKRHDNEKYCKRYVMISALFYPFWSTAYPDKASITEKNTTSPEGKWDPTGRGTFQADKVTANSLLIARQMALLSSPSVNLRVDARRLLRFRNRFQTWFLAAARNFRMLAQGEYGVLPVGHEHVIQRGSGALSIDVEKQKDLPGKNDLNQFYFDDDGLIQAYRADADFDKTLWGVSAKSGPQSPGDVAITIAQYNTVLGATLAFMSARANFLRNGPMMRVLLKDFPVSNFDSRVRAAMKYSADVGEMLPPPTGAVLKRSKILKRTLEPADGAGVAVVGAGLALGLVAFLRR